MRRRNNRSSSSAFTLAEMAMVMVVMGLVILTVFPALSAFRAANQAQATRSNLQTLMRATEAYVQAHGCVPCPSPMTSGSRIGIVRGDASATPFACGCSVAEGVPPYVSLGLPPHIAHDGWGRWIRMRVDLALTTNFGVVPPSLACTAANATGACPVGASAQGLCQSNLNTSATPVIKSPGNPDAPLTLTTQTQAAVVLISHGANGYGAYRNTSGATFAFPTSVPCSGGGFEACNATYATSGYFVDTSMISDHANGYDDLLLYAGRNALVSGLGSGSCSTSWGTQ